MARIPEETRIRTSLKFQSRIKFLIDEQELSKSEFAKAAGVNKEVLIRATVYGIIPSVKSLIKIADYLQVNLDYVLGETDNKDFYPAENPTTFHARLNQLIDEYQIKYSTVSKNMNFARNSIYEWMRTGSLPSLEFLIDLANYFEVSTDYLLGRTDER